MSSWFVYIVECGDKTLYTGITTDPVRRIKEHNAGKGSRYCRSRLPVKLVYLDRMQDRAQASRVENIIKQKTRQQKEELIKSVGIHSPICQCVDCAPKNHEQDSP